MPRGQSLNPFAYCNPFYVGRKGGNVPATQQAAPESFNPDKLRFREQAIIPQPSTLNRLNG